MSEKIMLPGTYEQFVELIETYYKQLELFVFQYGVKPSDVEQIMEGIVLSLGHRFTEGSEPSFTINEIFKEAIAHLMKADQAVLIEDEDDLEDLQGKRIFHFEEDESLHRAIAKLSTHEKLPFILQHFHHFNSGEASVLLEMAQSEMESLHTNSISQLERLLNMETDERIFKMLSFLQRAFERIGNLSDMDTVLSSAKRPQKNYESSNQSGKKKRERSSMWKPILLISIIMLFFGSILFVGETYGKVDDRYLTKLEEDFQKDKERKLEQLQLKESVFQELSFVSEINTNFELMIRRYKRMLEDGEKVEREKIREEYKELIESMALPSDMLDDLFKNPLNDDEKKSQLFFDKYLMRFEEIKYAYYRSRYETIWQNGQASEPSEVPEKTIKAMEKQNLQYRSIEGQEDFPAYLNNDVTKKLRESVHPSATPYVLYLEKSDPMYYIDKKMDSEELINTLKTIQDGMKGTAIHSDLYNRLSGIYVGYVMWTVDESWRNQEDSIFTSDGTVKPFYRELWKSFANSEEQSPLSALFQPIVSQMEESDWKFSQIQEYINYDHVNNALRMFFEKRLDEFTYTYEGHMLPMDQYMTEIAIDSDHYKNEVQRIYDNFKSNQLEPRSISTDNPLFLIGVYELAREEGNLKAMYELLYKTMPFDEFKEKWNVETPFLEGVESITIDQGLSEDGTNALPSVPVIFNAGGKEEIRAKLVYVNYYWLLDVVSN